MVAKYHLNVSPGLIWGEFYTIVRAWPFKMGLGAKFGRKPSQNRRKTNIYFGFLILVPVNVSCASELARFDGPLFWSRGLSVGYHPHAKQKHPRAKHKKDTCCAGGFLTGGFGNIEKQSTIVSEIAGSKQKHERKLDVVELGVLLLCLKIVAARKPKTTDRQLYTEINQTNCDP
jgi:hypothetical protein